MNLRKKYFISFGLVALLLVALVFSSVFTYKDPFPLFIALILIIGIPMLGVFFHIRRMVKIIENNTVRLEQKLGKLSSEKIDKSRFGHFRNIDTLFSHYESIITQAIAEHDLYENRLKELERINVFKNHTLDTLLKVNHLFLNLNDSDDYYEIILHSAIEVIENANKGSLLVLNQKDNLYEYHTCVGYDLTELKKVKMELEETFLYKNANNNFEAPAIIRNIKEFDTKILDESRVTFIENAGGLDIEEVLSAPIVIDGKIFAILNIDSDRKDAFDEIDLQLIHFFSSQIAIALKNKYLVDETVTMSRYDKLTGAVNRNYFEKIIDDHRDYTLDTLEPYAIVLCDLNYLKLINDSFGHSAGDVILKEFSNMIKGSIRESDVLSRIGGDEFVILLRSITLTHAEEKMSAIFENLKNHTIEFHGNELPVSFSYGVAASPDDSMIYDILVKIADIRMYKFKEKYKAEHPEILSIINTF